MSKPGAFTLIELLVVIAVIAVLMAIMTPALGKAREQARKVVCSAHMKGLGVSLRMYIDDNGGRTHRSPNRGLWDTAYEHGSVVQKLGPNDKMAYWGIAYYPYASNKRIFRCPSSRRVDDWPDDGWGAAYQQYFRYCSYGINGYVTWYTREGTAKERNIRVDTDFKRHDEVIVFQDHIEQKLDDVDSDMLCIGPGVSINLSQWRPRSQGGEGLKDTYWPDYDTIRECFRHTGLSNLCWLDGHVSGIKETTGEDVPTSWYTGVRTGSGV
ncbi:MAG: prepilin-type N-terminal cleavage/methylation domain-containing protein [Phycisphaerales bacterium]|jgi:prepilin-type N-terminal cleavage/methylation domain-containing protein/prepilin-type processing-associated H-X9-DG protein